jgi:hypothetical protein
MVSCISPLPNAWLEPNMGGPRLRTIQSTITFDAPFRLQGVPLLQPAGIYKIDSDEEVIEGNLRAVPVATRLHLRVGGSVRIRTVDRADLKAAWERDPMPDRALPTQEKAR